MIRSTPRHPSAPPLLVTAALCACAFVLSLPSAASAAGTIEAICKAQDADPPKGLKRYDLAALVLKARALTTRLGEAQARAADWDRWRAKWAWTPKARIRGLFAPSPSISCDGGDTASCVKTSNPNASSFKISGIFTRISVDLAMPLYTFGKLSAAKRAATAGVEAAKEKARELASEVELKVVRAYWGLKTAREILYTVCDGRKHIVKERARIQKLLDAQDDLDDDDEEDDEDEAKKTKAAKGKSKAKGKGKASKADEGKGAKSKEGKESEGDDNTVTLSDISRIKVYLAMVDSRLLEAVKLERFTKQALALLVGLPGASFDVDTAVLELVDGKLLPVARYAALARRHRPQAKLLEAAMRARKAALSLEKASFLPNLMFVATGIAAYAGGVDDPENAFYNDPFNVLTGGFGLALSWDFDPIQQYGKYRKAKALAEATKMQKTIAMRAIDVDIRSAYETLREARLRREVLHRAQRAVKGWLTATVQNLAAGLAKPKDLTDVLPKYFEMKLKYFQAVNDVNVGWAKLAQSIGTAPRGTASSKPAPKAK